MAKVLSKLENASQIIVQCPSCQTKFALDAKIIAEVEYPRFHCSRCDLVFALDESTSSRILNKNTPEFREEFSGLASHGNGPENIARENNVVNQSVNSNISYSDDFGHAQHQNAQASVANSQPQLPNDLTQNALIAPSFVRSAAQKTREESSSMLSSLNIKNISSNSLQNFQSSAPHESNKNQKDLAFQIDHPKRKELTQKKLSSSLSPSFSKEALVKEREELLNEKAAQANSNTSQISHWKSLGKILIPIFTFLFGLVVVGNFLSHNPEKASQLLKFLGQDIAQSAPTGLNLSATSFSKVTLESGEQVYTINGQLLNQSENDFKEILIEAHIYNQKAEILSQVMVNVASTLARTKIKSLTPEMIESIQSSTQSPNFVLRKEQTQDFVIAFLENSVTDKSNQPTYYSLRIYSVKRS